jgi:hypothetical protein
MVSLTSLLAQKKEVDETLVNPSCGCPYTLAERQFAMEEELTLHVDTAASFKGGEAAFRKYQDWLIQHPALNQNDSTKHSILCRFIVERDGKINNIELLNHSDKIFETEALQIIQNMPKWNPAKKDGKAVRSWHTIKLFFGYPSQLTKN